MAIDARIALAGRAPNVPNLLGMQGEAAVTNNLLAKTDLMKQEAATLKDETQYSTAMMRSKDALRFVNSPDAYMAWHNSNHSDPVLGPMLAKMGITADSGRAKIMQQLSQPGGLETLIGQSASSIEKLASTMSAQGADARGRATAQTENARRQAMIDSVMGNGQTNALATPPASSNALAMPVAPPRDTTVNAEGSPNALRQDYSATLAQQDATAGALPLPPQATGGADPRLAQVAQFRALAARGVPGMSQAADQLQKAVEFDQKQNPTMELKDRFVPVGKNVFDRQTQKFVSPPTPDDVSEIIPTLEKGEKWNSDTQRVEAVPGSKLYITQNSKQNKDLQTVKGVNTKTEQALAKIDEILSPNNASAFEGNFGGYNAYTSQMLPGENSNLRKKIDSFKSNMKAVGLELMRSGGSIGQMTEKEWPIVEQMIGSLDPVMGEEDARMAFQKIRARMQRIADDANEIYDNNWSDTQYYAPDKKGNTKRAGSVIVNVNGADYTFPNAEAANNFKRKAGIK